jgi:hypothetical protein
MLKHLKCSRKAIKAIVTLLSHKTLFIGFKQRENSRVNMMRVAANALEKNNFT